MARMFSAEKQQNETKVIVFWDCEHLLLSEFLHEKQKLKKGDRLVNRWSEAST
jgi:hypothetical protein